MRSNKIVYVSGKKYLLIEFMLNLVLGNSTILYILVCGSPPETPENATSNSSDLPINHMFLDGDVVAYMCNAEHFDFEDRMYVAVCENGTWTPSVIASCAQHCKCIDIM